MSPRSSQCTDVQVIMADSFRAVYSMPSPLVVASLLPHIARITRAPQYHSGSSRVTFSSAIVLYQVMFGRPVPRIKLKAELNPLPNLCNERTQLFQGTLQMFLQNMFCSVLSTWACPCSLAYICHFLIKIKPSSTEVPRALGAENDLNLKSSASSKRECVCHVVKQSGVCYLKKPGRTQCPRTLSNVMSLR